MIGSEVLLFPDSGAKFQPLLRTAALYSSRIRTVGSIDLLPFLTPLSDGLSGIKEKGRPIWDRTILYCDGLRAAEPEVSVLRSEGLLADGSSKQPILLEEALQALIQSQRENQERFTQWMCAHRSDWENLERLSRSGPPHFFDLAPTLAIGGRGQMSIEEYVARCNRLSPYLLVFYLLLVLSLSESHGATPFTWSSELLHASNVVRRIPGQILRDAENNDTAGLTVFKAIERYLPRVEDLPIGEILEIRRKRKPELEALRVGLAALGTELDPTKPPTDLERQLENLFRAKLDPAVHDLRVSLRAARLDALRKIGQSWESLAGALVPFVIGISAGAPLNIQAALAVLGGTLGPFVVSEVERAKARNASQWSILLRLQELAK